MYFRQYWKDERLKYNHTEYRKRLAFNPQMLKFIWVPDTHFPGIKDGLKHEITDANEVIRLWPDGSVLYSMRFVNVKYSKLRCRVIKMFFLPARGSTYGEKLSPNLIHYTERA